MNLINKTLLRFEFKSMLRHGIIPVAAVLTIIYIAIFLLLDTHQFEKVIAALIFSDPVMYGFLFTSVVILFEKDNNIHQALGVIPFSARQYFISKIIAYNILALLCSSLMLLAAQPERVNILSFIMGVLGSSTLFILISIAATARVKNFNQFIAVIPFLMTPVALPFLSFFDLANHWSFYLIPTQACLILFKHSLSETPVWELLYAIAYLTLCIALSSVWASRWYKKYMVN